MAGIVPAILTGGAQVVGAGIGSAGSKHAANLQAQATQQALDFEKQREAQRKAEYEQRERQAQLQWNTYQTQMSPYRNIAAQYLARYGYKPALWTLGDYANPNAPRGVTPVSNAGLGMAPNGAMGMGAPRSQSLADIYNSPYKVRSN